MSQINSGTDKIHSRMKASKSYLNIKKKTNFTSFAPKRFTRTMEDILINGYKVSEVNDTKLVAVIIDNKLNWSPHMT